MNQGHCLTILIVFIGIEIGLAKVWWPLALILPLTILILCRCFHVGQIWLDVMNEDNHSG